MTHPTGVQIGPARQGRRRWWALGFLVSANLLVFAAVTIMNVALPDARADLALPPSTVRAIVTSYSLTFGTLILLAGRAADVFGLRRCLVAGLVGFAATSLLGAAAVDGRLLLAARALQGATGAFVAATAVSLISVVFPTGRARQTAFATLGVVMGIGTAGSFLLGGALVHLLSWRWCLLVNAPLALAVVAGVASFAPQGTRTRQSRLDLPGALLLCASLSALVLGLDRVSVWGWRSTAALALLLAGIVGLVAFASRLRRSPQPLIPVWLLTDRTRVVAYASAGLAGIGMFAGMFLLTAFLQDIRDQGPVEVGLGFIPFGVSAVLTTWALPALRARFSPVMVLTLGLLMAAGAVGTFVGLGPDTDYARGALPAMVLLGSGGTIVMITAADVATAGAGEDSGVAGSMVNAAQQVGAALGTALLTSVSTTVTRTGLGAGKEPIVASVEGHAAAGLVGGGLLCMAALVIALLGRPGRGAFP